MLLIGIGALLATTLLATAPIYTDTMADIGLRFRLERELDEPRFRVVHVSTEGMRLGDPVHLAQVRGIEKITEARVGWLATEVVVEQRSEALRLSFGNVSERRPWQVRLVHISDFEEHVTVIEGRLPLEKAVTAEVVLPDGFQREAAVGDQVLLTMRRYDDCPNIPPSEDEEVAADEVPCAPSTFVSASLQAEIVGFVRPNEINSHRWQFFEDGWLVPDNPLPSRRGSSIDEGQGWMPLLTSGEYYSNGLTRQLPELHSRYRAGIVPDLQGLAVRDVPRALDDLQSWPLAIQSGLDVTVAQRLEFADALAKFRNAQTFSQIPLLLLLLQVSGVVAFYIVVLTALARERQTQEIAVYRSRGANTPQLLGLTMIEGLLLTLPAVLAGPFLAERAVAALGHSSAFQEITGGAGLPVSRSEDAFLLAAAGGVLALGAMLLPALSIVRRAIVATKHEQARPQQRGWFQRYYLDLALVLLAALLVWQLKRRGSVFDPDSVGGWEADPLLLLSPMVITAAVAAAILRLYPPALRLLAKLSQPIRGTAPILGFGRAGRDPGTTARLILLISTAVAVGTFAASYAPTVDRSFVDRAHYSYGVDLRAGIAEPLLSENDNRLAEIRTQNGVEQAVLVHRSAIGVPWGGALQMLAVDDRELTTQMLRFRNDFGNQSSTELLSQLDMHIPLAAGLELPGDTVAIELLTFTEVQPRIARLRASILDGNGQYHQAIFESLQTGEWTRISANLPPGLPPPLTLASLGFADLRMYVRSDGEIFFDDLTARRANGERVLIDNFEDRFSWTMYSQAGATETFGPSATYAMSGERSARWTWTREIVNRARILAPDNLPVPLNAIFSERALEIFGVQSGANVTALLGDGFEVPIIVRGTTKLFPTLDPEIGFVIVGMEQLRSIAGALGIEGQQRPTELWIDFEEGTSLSEQQAFAKLMQKSERSPLKIEKPLLLADRLHEITADPTLQAAGSGILLLAFVSVLAAATLGFVVTLTMTIRARVTEIAVLRSLGSSRHEILRALALEWGTVLIFGTALGVLLGRQIASLMLQFLEITENGDPVVPSFSVITEWGLLAVGLGGLAVIAAFTLWMSWRLVLRRAGASALRLTE